jgi:hypothetical protein
MTPDIEEKPIAKSFIYKANDERNSCFLTDKRLVIVKRGKSYEFLLNEVLAVSLRDRKILFPIIIGGIVFSLSVVAIYTNDYNPYILLTSLLAGLAMLYFGFTGMKAISVIEPKAETNFFLLNYDPSLDHFLEFVNRYIQRHEGSVKYYLPVSEHHQNETIQAGTRLYEHYDIMKSFEGKTLEVLEVDTSLPGVSVRYITEEASGNFQPVLDADIATSELKLIHMRLTN